MILFSTILVLAIQLSEIDLFVSISDISSTLHNLCLKFTPKSFYSEIYAALVCGQRLKSTALIENLKNLGIYHVIVVSGSHLIFLSLLIEKFNSVLKWNYLKIIILPLLVLYSLATGCEAPVTRALFSLGIRRFQNKQKLFWNESEISFISLLLCFLLFSQWTESYSLLLSYAASVSLTLTQTSKNISKHIMIYIILLPFLLPLAAPHPLSIFSNMTLTPFIAGVMFPISMASFIIHPLTYLIDPLWKILLDFCTLIGNELSTLSPFDLALPSLWILAIALNFFGIYYEKRYKK